MSVEGDHVACPACGGAGGGPFGPAGSAWDTEEFVCPRCKGRGWIGKDEAIPMSQRPGIAKTVPDEAPAQQKKKKATG